MSTPHKERAHALLSASGSSRWLNCTASARLEDQVPNVETSYSAEGTVAHELSEAVLRSRIYGDAHTVNTGQHPAEMIAAADSYVNTVLEYYNDLKAQDAATVIMIETRVDFSDVVPEGFGSCDCIIVGAGRAVVIDFKYGQGVKVNAWQNSQLRLYAHGAVNLLSLSHDVTEVTTLIVQPRLDHISSETLSAAELQDWAANYVAPKAKQAWSGEGEQVPGDWCTFCRVRNRCKALADEALAVAQRDFADPKLLGDDELLAIAAKAKRLVSWLNGLDAYMLSEALAGKSWQGYKLVEGRSVRSIKNEQAAKDALLADGYTLEDVTNSKLKGLGDLEKLVGKKRLPEVLGALIVKPQGKPTLAPESDPRQAFDPTADAVAAFDDGYVDSND